MAKKERKSRNDHTLIYIELEDKHLFYDTRYFGLFRKGDRSRIDPKRFNKLIPGYLDKAIMDYINKRKTHFFMPKKKSYTDYNINIFLYEIKKIEDDWEQNYKIQIKKTLRRLKRRKFSVGDDYGYMSGIESYGSAVARAHWRNMMEENEYFQKVHEIISSMYSQYFHMMASQIEAITIKVLSINHVKVNKSLREVLRGTLIKKSNFEDLPGFKFHDRLYKIWNFIKHNNEDAYIKLKEYHPETLYDYEYRQGDLAIHYVKFNDQLIVDILKGLRTFYINYCEQVFDEDIFDAQWNYDDFFLDRVRSEIEIYQNPLGLDMFSDID